MATWTTPVTDRTDGTARTTYQDMERITGNLKWIYDNCVSEGIPISGSAISKTSWTRNDILDVTFWAELKQCLTYACAALSYTPTDVVVDDMTWNNFNLIETIELQCYNVLAAYVFMPRLNHYVGDNLFAGDAFNAGGRYS